MCRIGGSPDRSAVLIEVIALGDIRVLVGWGLAFFRLALPSLRSDRFYPCLVSLRCKSGAVRIGAIFALPCSRFVPC